MGTRDGKRYSSAYFGRGLNVGVCLFYPSNNIQRFEKKTCWFQCDRGWCKDVPFVGWMGTEDSSEARP